MVQVYVTSAFSKDGKGGNKAGVVLNRPDLGRQQKMDIARELGYSETAFILPSEMADFEIQYFTPTDEVPLCGHATIASFSTLKLLNLLNKENYTIQTKAGILNIEVKEDGLVFMEQNRPEYSEVLAPELLRDCLGEGMAPIQIVSTGLRDIIFPVASREELDGLKPDFEKMAQLSGELNVVGVHAFSLSKEPGIDAVCRNFAPLYGIDEESATGTASCALACYLHKHHEKKEQYVFEQGYSLKLPSRITVKLQCLNDEIKAVYVGGYGYLAEEKTLKETVSMKVYGSDICIDCRNYKAIEKSRGFQAEYIDITENTANLKEFLKIRDTDPVFEAVRERGGIGIPLFVKEDGTKTFDIDEALSWIAQPAVKEEEIVERAFSCGIDGCK